MSLMCPFVDRDCETRCQGYKENREGEGYCGIVGALANLPALTRLGKEIMEVVLANSKGDTRRRKT